MRNRKPAGSRILYHIHRRFTFPQVFCIILFCWTRKGLNWAQSFSSFLYSADLLLLTMQVHVMDGTIDGEYRYSAESVVEFNMQDVRTNISKYLPIMPFVKYFQQPREFIQPRPMIFKVNNLRRAAAFMIKNRIKFPSNCHKYLPTKLVSFFVSILYILFLTLHQSIVILRKNKYRNIISVHSVLIFVAIASPVLTS